MGVYYIYYQPLGVTVSLQMQLKWPYFIKETNSYQLHLQYTPLLCLFMELSCYLFSRVYKTLKIP